MLGGGWTVGTGPTITYNWENEQWAVPLQIKIGLADLFGLGDN
jgi:hypothetical protein